MSDAEAPEHHAGRNGGELRHGSRTPGPGIPKGSKQLKTLAHITLTALDRLGGVHYLMKMGNSKHASDRAAFMGLIGRYVPLQFEANVDQTLTVKIVEYALVPSHGTALIGESERIASLPESNAAETADPEKSA